jgi:geranylgeranylglycerol-phosphate geranylgeranyltransferase
MAALGVYIAYFIVSGNFFFSTEITLGILATFFACAGGMAINDYFDAHIDKINKPKRPIPSGAITRRNALAFSAFLFVLGNALAFRVSESLMPLYVSLIASLLLIAYAAKLKRVIMIGHLTISFLVALTFLFGGIIAGNIGKILILAVLAFLSNTGREIYKTIEDALGDKKMNVKTITIKLGAIRAKMLANYFIVAAVILSFIPFLIGMFNEIYLFFVVLADIVFLSAILLPVKHSSKACKIGMVIALFAFFVGSIY